MESACDKGKGIEIWEDKTERNDSGPMSDKNVTRLVRKTQHCLPLCIASCGTMTPSHFGCKHSLW